jgi:hypothetical protein
MESSEEESGLLHQVKERLSISTDESASSNALLKAGDKVKCVYKSLQNFWRRTCSQFFAPHSLKNFPRKGAQR